ncbi:MAG: sugar phosphate isomerase/epimerase family protein [Melioribacteraceae bacterium]|nr:sugar phosphate isomerase/epimerase family protein [Melioribacteraceae bacterium]
MIRKIGIMQGRLSEPLNGKIQSFPKTTWQEEFDKAVAAGLNAIEWIFEADEWEKNPISSEIGIKEINDFQKKTGIEICSVCADYFMDIPYFSADSNLRKDLKEKLNWLVVKSSEINASFIDIPFVDASRIPSHKEFDLVEEMISEAAGKAAEHNIILALETSLNPSDFKTLLQKINHPNVMSNYDTGNSSGIGYNCVEELSAYGNYIRTIHIKDRLLTNGTKPLGTGSADFHSFFKTLSNYNYSGPIILQAAREQDGEEVSTAIKNRKFVEEFLRIYN